MAQMTSFLTMGENWQEARGVDSDGWTNSSLAPRDYSIPCDAHKLIAQVEGYNVWWCSTHHQPLPWCEKDKAIDQRDANADQMRIDAKQYNLIIDALKERQKSFEWTNQRLTENCTTCLRLLEEAGLGKTGPNCLVDMVQEAVQRLKKEVDTR